MKKQLKLILDNFVEENRRVDLFDAVIFILKVKC